MEVVVLSEETPLASWILRVLRDESTGSEEFREWTRRAGRLLAGYVARSLEWRRTRVRTPLGAEAEELEPARPPLLIGVLGAGLPLLQGLAEMIPGSLLGFVAARRREEPGRVSIEVYYERLPERHEGPVVIVDPMLATGQTIARVAELASSRGASRIVVASVIAAREGLSLLAAQGIVETVYTLAVDPMLNKDFFIVPGLGDAGDRGLGVEPG